MRTYIAGPMTGHADYNRPAFQQGEQYCFEQGWTPVNPWGVDPQHEGVCPIGEVFTHFNGSHPWACWLKASLRLQLTCEAILLLPGWELSRGACVEYDVAEKVHMSIRFMPELKRSSGIYPPVTGTRPAPMKIA